MADRENFGKIIWPVAFILILSVVFVGLLAVLFRLNEPRIEDNKRQTYERSILALCADSLAKAAGKTAADIEQGYPDSFKEYISPLPEAAFSRPAFEARIADRLIAYVFDIPGKGLWGTMRALVATTPDKSTIIGINIYDQVETPGLGARIEENWFTGQFRQKTVIQDGKPVQFTLIPEGQEAADPTQVRQVTGATITSSAVIKMLQEELGAISSRSAEVAK